MTFQEYQVSAAVYWINCGTLSDAASLPREILYRNLRLPVMSLFALQQLNPPIF